MTYTTETVFCYPNKCAVFVRYPQNMQDSVYFEVDKNVNPNYVL